MLRDDTERVNQQFYRAIFDNPVENISEIPGPNKMRRASNPRILRFRFQLAIRPGDSKLANEECELKARTGDSRL